MSSHVPPAEYPDLQHHQGTFSVDLENADINGAPYFPPLGPQSVTYTPTPNTPISSLGNVDTFISALNQELHHTSNPFIICSVKQNNEPENAHGLLEQRLEKKMNVQLSVVSPAANQRINLPVPPATLANVASEPNLLFLSLVIAGETTRRIFGGVGLYHQNQPTSDLVSLVGGTNSSPVVGITSGRTVCIGFKFTTYPRQCDPSEGAFRVVATVHDCDGNLVAYSLSAFAYSVKAHPRNSKRALQALTRSRMRGLSALNTAPLNSVTGTHTLPSSSSATSGSGPQQPGGSTNTDGLPAPLAHQPMPTLFEVVPSSCSWHDGIVVSLFVHNLPQDGPIYARFGSSVVPTNWKAPDVLICRVPPALGPCSVDVTLSKGVGPIDVPYGRSLCKFTYNDPLLLLLMLEC